MDWNKCIADQTYFGEVPYTSGRSGRKLEFIVLHHNGGFESLDSIVNTFNSRSVSAHYQVADNAVGQYVYTAWHAGNWDANCKSIGIEHRNSSINPYRISTATLDTGSHLVAALCKLYGLGAPEWGKNVFPHSHFTSTDCPGSLADNQRDDYMASALHYYNAMCGISEMPSAPAPDVSDFSGGTYRCTVDRLRIRFAPGLNGTIDTAGCYNKGDTVILDNWYTVKDGYVWGRYTSYSGHTKYIAVGKATGKPENDDFLIKVG